MEWADAKLEKGGGISIGGPPKTDEGKKRLADLQSRYTMSWQHGFVNSGEKEEKWARIWSALFIFLWCQKIGVELAEHLASFYIESMERWEREQNV